MNAQQIRQGLESRVESLWARWAGRVILPAISTALLTVLVWIALTTLARLDNAALAIVEAQRALAVNITNDENQDRRISENREDIRSLQRVFRAPPL